MAQTKNYTILTLGEWEYAIEYIWDGQYFPATRDMPEEKPTCEITQVKLVYPNDNSCWINLDMDILTEDFKDIAETHIYEIND